jgi:prepilin signal peptidase PulO-like enzyme (type II secretory pathway)
MVLMIIVALIIFGLCFGSFVNALTWRIHEQAKENEKSKVNKKYLQQLSILHGRSFCPHCKHQLASKDLIPVFSWLSLKGKCRYCSHSIALQYPLVELSVAALFVVSYIFWPVDLHGPEVAVFIAWLLILTGLIALVVYDLRWYLLPNRIIYPLGVIAVIQAGVIVSQASSPLSVFYNDLAAVVIGGGIFFAIYQISSGKWIGGGDVRLGLLLGLLAGTAEKSLALIFIASVLGCLVSIPLIALKHLKPSSTIPFGPFLIGASIIVVLFGTHIIHWYQQNFIRF